MLVDDYVLIECHCLITLPGEMKLWTRAIVSTSYYQLVYPLGCQGNISYIHIQHVIKTWLHTFHQCLKPRQTVPAIACTISSCQISISEQAT